MVVHVRIIGKDFFVLLSISTHRKYIEWMLQIGKEMAYTAI